MAPSSAAQSVGTITQAKNNGAVFMDSKSNDFLISTSTLTQKILMGFSSNFPSTISLGKSNMILGTSSSNVSLSHYGDTYTTGHLDVVKNISSSNLSVANCVSIGSLIDPTLSLIVGGSTRINGDLIVNGDINAIDTNVTVTDQLLLVNDGTGSALHINQLGMTPVADLQFRSNTVFLVQADGKVAIGSNTPLQTLDVQGNTFIRGNLSLSNILSSNIEANNIVINSNGYIPNTFVENLYMGNKLVIDTTGIITNSNFIPTLDTSKIQYGTFTSNFIENYNIISEKLHSNLTIAGVTTFAGTVGIDTYTPNAGNPYVKLKVFGGDATITGHNDFQNPGDQARLYLGNPSHFIAASCNVGIVMQVPNTSYPFVLEDTSGFVGLGIQDPQERLHVAENAKIGNNIYILSNVAVGHSNPLETVAIKGNLSLSNQGKIVIYTSNDNLGINTNVPTAKLHVLHTTTGDAFLVEDQSSVDPSPFIIKNDGHVGIGTTTPSEHLELIGGSAKMSSNLYVMYRIAIQNSNPYYDLDVTGTSRCVQELNVDGTSVEGARIRLCSKGTTAEGTSEWKIENKSFGTDTDYLRVFKYSSSGSSNMDDVLLLSDDGLLRLGGNLKAQERLHVSHGHTKMDSNLYVFGTVGYMTSNPEEEFHIAQGNAKMASNLYVMSRIGVAKSNPQCTFDVLGDSEFTGKMHLSNGDLSIDQWVALGTSVPQEALDIRNGNIDTYSNVYIGWRLGIANKIPSERIDLQNGNMKVNSNIYIFNNLGINTSNPRLAIETDRKDGILLPRGSDSERPSINEQGVMRYNIDSGLFEGYATGDKWTPIGQSRDVNRDTYISFESFPSSNDDIIRFYNSNVETVRVMPSGLIGISNMNPTERIDMSYGNAKLRENVYILGSLAISHSNPTEKVDIKDGNLKVSSNIYALTRFSVGKSNPSVLVEMHGTDAVLIPKGTSGQRPLQPTQGHIRYNTTTMLYEAYNEGNVWGSLNDVRDTNLDTYIVAEPYPSSNDDILRFVNSNISTMYITSNLIFMNVAMTLSNDLKINKWGQMNIYTSNNCLGLQTNDPLVTLHIEGTDSVLIPKGTTSQRPSNLTRGLIRFNTQTEFFEGYGANNLWLPLGGPHSLRDANQDTFITAESASTSNEDILRFVNNGNESLRLMPNGRMGISNVSPQERLHLSGGNAKFDSNVYVATRIGVGLSNPEQSVHVVGNVRASNGTLGPMMMLLPPLAYADIPIGDKLILDSSIEAGNTPSASNLFMGSGFLYQDKSDDNMVWPQGRLIFRGTAQTSVDNENTSMVIQDYVAGRNPLYSNITEPFNITSKTKENGFLTSASPWFEMSSSNVRHLAISVIGSSNNSSYRFGAVYIQFRA